MIKKLNETPKGLKIILKKDINYNDFQEIVLVKENAKFLDIDLNLKDGQSTIYQKSNIAFIKNNHNSYEMGSNLAKKLQSIELDKVLCIIDFASDKELYNIIEAAYLYYPKFDVFKAKKQNTKEIIIQVANPEKYNLNETDIIVECTQYAKNLINLPPNYFRPSDFETHMDNFKQLGIKVTNLSGKDIEKMGCLKAVGQGSSDKSRLIVAEWKKNDGPYVALVGKGITFDSGGLCVKTAAQMLTMKTDMAGAASVMAVIQAVAKLNLNINLVAIMGCSENMTGSDAYRVDDVLISYSGQTVEIINTDAEGRLVLCDAMSYVQDKYNVSTMIDLATLTGAIVASLGERYAGIFSNDKDLCKNLIDSGDNVEELLWRMPLHKDYDKLNDSDIADMKNLAIGSPGAITAAQFLQRFVKSNVKWAHIDIAGVAFTKKPSSFHNQDASGFGVRLLINYIKKNCVKS